MPNNHLTGTIIGAAIEVHKVLGPGLLESAYEESLCHELARRNLIAAIGLDLLVENQVAVELKAIEGIRPIHDAIMLTYLKLSGHKIGLLVNFHVTMLNDGIRRFVL